MKPRMRWAGVIAVLVLALVACANPEPAGQLISATIDLETEPVCGVDKAARKTTGELTVLDTFRYAVDADGRPAPVDAEGQPVPLDDRVPKEIAVREASDKASEKRETNTLGTCNDSERMVCVRESTTAKARDGDVELTESDRLVVVFRWKVEDRHWYLAWQYAPEESHNRRVIWFETGRRPARSCTDE